METKKINPDTTKLNVRKEIRLNEQQRTLLEKAAKEQNTSESSILRNLINEHLAKA